VQPVKTSTRRPDVDWLRVLLFGGLIAYHIGLLYAPWSPYALKSAQTWSWVEGVLLGTHPWRMLMLFFISGVACRFALDKLGPPRLLASRSQQLLPPLVFGVLLLVPIQTYLWSVETLGYQKHYGAFLVDVLSGGYQKVLVNGRLVKLNLYAHLWFILYLWAYVTVLVGALVAAPRWLPWLQARLERVLHGPGLLLWPIAVLIALRFSLYPQFGMTLEIFNDWYNHALSFGVFLVGFVIARSERVWAGFAALRWPALAMALAAWGGYAMMWAGVGIPETVEKANPWMHPLYSVEQWSAIVAVLGFAHRWLRHDSPPAAVRYLNGGIFTYYVIHQPALLIMLHFLKPLGLHGAVEAACVFLGTAAICAFAYEGAKNLGWFGALVGARPARAKPRPAPGAALAARPAS